MSSARAYKTFKRRQVAMEKSSERTPVATDSAPTGLLKRKTGGESKKATPEDMTKVISDYIKAIRGL